MAHAHIVRYDTLDDATSAHQVLIEKVFAELAAEDPGDIRYAVFSSNDGRTFLHVVVNESEGEGLPRLAAFREFQQEIGSQLAGKPTREDISIVGSYRFDLD